VLASVEELLKEALAVLVGLAVPRLIGRLITGLVSRLDRRGRRRGLCRPCLLPIDESLQFPAIEENASAFTALVDVDPASLIGTHRAVALWAGQLRHISMMWDEAECGNSRQRIEAGPRMRIG